MVLRCKGPDKALLLLATLLPSRADLLELGVELLVPELGYYKGLNNENRGL